MTETRNKGYCIGSALIAELVPDPWNHAHLHQGHAPQSRVGPKKLHRAMIFTGVEQCSHDYPVEVVNKIVAGLSGVDSVEGNGASRPGLAIAYRVDTCPGEPEFSPLGTLPSRKRHQTNRGEGQNLPNWRLSPPTDTYQQPTNISRS